MNNEIEKYQEEIIKMIRKCNNLHWLKTVYAYVKRLLG